MSEPLRVLHVVTTMNQGGIETMLMNYYRKMDKSQIQFDFLKHRDGNHVYDEEIEDLGGRLFVVPPANPFDLRYRNALKTFFSNNEYQVVHSHINCMSALPLMIAKESGASLRIAHAHSSNQVKDIRYPIKMLCRKMIPFSATELFACSADAGQFMFGDHDFRVFPNAIEADKYTFSQTDRDAVRRSWEIDEETFVLGHVGRFSMEKNHRFLIRTFKALRDKGVRAKLVLAGDGGLREQVGAEVKSANLSSDVLFLGRIDDVPAVLSGFDLFSMPSRYEGLGMALVEAQASGLPCVASDTVPTDGVVAAQLVSRMSLQDSPDAWAREYLAMHERVPSGARSVNPICGSSYDVNVACESLKAVYLDSL